MDVERLAHIRAVVDEGIARNQLPGCVVAIGYRGCITFLEAFGNRQTLPTELPMTTETVFDLASLTKPVATASSILKLTEQGRIDLDSPVMQYWPAFGAEGKESVTVKHLLLHQGGLIADNPLSDYSGGRTMAMQKICQLKLVAEPGTRFIYTDVGYIVLAEIVRQVSGLPIDEFSQQQLFAPLGMSETRYRPPKQMRLRSAPADRRDGEFIKGEVHDPRAYALDGIAGHAGLFSTAKDLSCFAQMLLNGGTLGGQQVFHRETVRRMTTPVRGPGGMRGLGWDVRTAYSSNRGDLFSESAFGHGGFTGTSLWMDPEQDLFVIFLSNRLHPDGKGSVNRLAARIATIAASSIERIKNDGPDDETDSHSVSTGIDELQRSGFEPITGKRVGLITNHTGINRQGLTTIEILHESSDVNLTALFSPEHGLRGNLDQQIQDSIHSKTGIPVHSLYGDRRRPSDESLLGVDVLVFDIQDIGTRFYTYISTMGNCMQAAAKHSIEFVVLDRPNPINGIHVQGPLLDAGKESFVGFHRIPVRHGMTIGELAMMFRAEMNLDLKLTVVEMKGWKREHFFEATGLFWVNPSPNIRNLTQALLYPGIGLLETTNLSVGRGTDTPFEVIGAPWIDAQALARQLNVAHLSGARVIPIRFVPDSSKFAGQPCHGINIIVTDRRKFDPLRFGLQLATTLRALYPEKWEIQRYGRLLGNDSVLADLKSGSTVDEMRNRYQPELLKFRERRQAYLRY